MVFIGMQLNLESTFNVLLMYKATKLLEIGSRVYFYEHFVQKIRII